MAVCETRLRDVVKDAEVTLEFPNFTLFRADRGLGPDGRPCSGGGVALYLRDDFSDIGTPMQKTIAGVVNPNYF